MTQEAAKLSTEAEWPPLDRQSLLETLDLFKRTTELERIDRGPDPERLALLEWREDVIQGIVFCRYCLVLIVALLAVIALRM